MEMQGLDSASQDLLLMCIGVSTGRPGPAGARPREDGGVSGLSSSCGALWGFSREARRGSQGASRAAPGKSGLPARGEGERVMALESREGIRASRRVDISIRMQSSRE